MDEKTQNGLEAGIPSTTAARGADDNKPTAVIRRHFNAELSPRGADIILLLCWFTTGFLDSTIFQGEPAVRRRRQTPSLFRSLSKVPKKKKYTAYANEFDSIPHLRLHANRKHSLHRPWRRIEYNQPSNLQLQNFRPPVRMVEVTALAARLLAWVIVLLAPGAISRGFAIPAPHAHRILRAANAAGAAVSDTGANLDRRIPARVRGRGYRLVPPDPNRASQFPGSGASGLRTGDGAMGSAHGGGNNYGV